MTPFNGCVVSTGLATSPQSLRNAGYRDQREVAGATHDIVVKMLTGGLFRDYDERQHGPFDLRFKRAAANAIRNMVEKDRNRRRLHSDRSNRL